MKIEKYVKDENGNGFYPNFIKKFMSKDNFKIPPVSTLLGADINTFGKILKTGKISPEYRLKVALTSFIVLVSTPFHRYEEIVFNKKRLAKTKFENPPLFILGHWRSGTTLLHNLLCLDPDSSFVTTYQSVFPNNLASKIIFKTFMKYAMPNRRPADNMKLEVDLPQEDEFAFSNMYYINYYNFFYFPYKYKYYYDKSVRFKDLSDNEFNDFLYNYEKLLKKTYLNRKGKQLIIKNPVNTARIKALLKLYPDAKFIYIYRNPVTVFMSTHNFFQAVIKTLMLHKVPPEFIDDMIFDVYKKLIDDYHVQKNLIPAKNLFEIKYEEFEKAPLKGLENIYNNLLDKDFEQLKGMFSDYLESLKSHKKQHYKIEKQTLDRITNELGKYMEIYGYDVPGDIEILK